VILNLLGYEQSMTIYCCGLCYIADMLSILRCCQDSSHINALVEVFTMLLPVFTSSLYNFRKHSQTQSHTMPFNCVYAVAHMFTAIT